jgi:glycosyltransferase involved in cell wall biosynthesis
MAYSVRVVVPCKNEGMSLNELLYSMLNFKSKISDENNLTLLLIDDGSTDDTKFQIERLIEENQYDDFTIKFISLNKNYGKEVAQAIGLIQDGNLYDYNILIDADGQFDISDALRVKDQLFGDELWVGKRINYKRRALNETGVRFLQIILGFFGIKRDFTLSDFIILPRKHLQTIIKDKSFSSIPVVDVVLKKKIKFNTFDVNVKSRSDGTLSTRWSLLKLGMKSLQYFFIQPEKVLNKIILFLGLFVFIILSYGIYVGVSSVKNNLYSGIGSLIIIVITGFAIQFTTMISLMLYILNQIKQREFRSNWKNWIDKNE